MTRIQDIRAISMAQFDYPLSDETHRPFSPWNREMLPDYWFTEQARFRTATFISCPNTCRLAACWFIITHVLTMPGLFFIRRPEPASRFFCLEPLAPRDYAQNFQSTESCEWLCLVGNSKKWKEGPLCNRYLIDGKKIQLEAEKMNPIDNAIEFGLPGDRKPIEAGYRFQRTTIP
jgi:S-adenosylmethionine:tRNA ribosyltransferase-isomerase